MAIATYNYVTLRQVIANAKLRCMPHLSASDTTWDMFFKSAAIEASKEMMTALDFNEYTRTLEICDYIAILPSNFVMFDKPQPLVFTVDGQVGTANSVDLPYNNSLSVSYIGNAFIVNSPYSGTFNNGFQPTINVQDGKLYFSTNITNTECTISYLGVNVDENGVMQIPEMNARVIMYFLISEFKRANGINGWQTDQALWSQGKKDRKGKANLPGSFERVAGQINWNRLV